MDVTTSFKIGAAVWDGDKFLIETATEGGNKQIKVTAEVVKAYLGGSGGSGGALDMRVLPFTGIVEDMEVKQESVAGGAYGLGIYYVRSRGCFAAAPLGMLSGRPTSGALNWEGRELYENEDFIPRQGNLYVCSSDDKGYWYNGVSLRQLASVECGHCRCWRGGNGRGGGCGRLPGRNRPRGRKGRGDACGEDGRGYDGTTKGDCDDGDTGGRGDNGGP